MKKLICAFAMIFMITLNGNAEVKRVDVTNSVTNKQFTATFGHDPEYPIENMQPWINRQKNLAKNCKSWGCEGDYVMTITDLTAEYEAAQAAKEARETEIDQIKQAIGLVDASSKPAWEKKLLKRLILELRK